MRRIRISSRCAEGRAGFSMLELVIAMTTLTVGVLGFSKAIVAWNRAAEGARLKTEAVQAARRVVEDLQSKDFSEVFALYNSVAADDPVAAVIPGPTFSVAGLTPWPAAPDGFVGQVILPSALVGGAETLREDSVITELGMPRDLNADGVIDAADHSGDYRLLPVIVRVRWLGPNGQSQLDIKTILGEFL